MAEESSNVIRFRDLKARVASVRDLASRAQGALELSQTKLLNKAREFRDAYQLKVGTVSDLIREGRKLLAETTAQSEEAFSQAEQAVVKAEQAAGVGGVGP